MDCVISGSATVREDQSQKLVIIIRTDFNQQYTIAVGKAVQGSILMCMEVTGYVIGGRGENRGGKVRA